MDGPVGVGDGHHPDTRPVQETSRSTADRPEPLHHRSRLVDPVAPQAGEGRLGHSQATHQVADADALVPDGESRVDPSGRHVGSLVQESVRGGEVAPEPGPLRRPVHLLLAKTQVLAETPVLRREWPHRGDEAVEHVVGAGVQWVAVDAALGAAHERPAQVGPVGDGLFHGHAVRQVGHLGQGHPAAHPQAAAAHPVGQAVHDEVPGDARDLVHPGRAQERLAPDCRRHHASLLSRITTSEGPAADRPAVTVSATSSAHAGSSALAATRVLGSP
ncbi:MAG: hypothetical protein U0R64_08775 [Candidatus Nanopelagicales bacterium]